LGCVLSSPWSDWYEAHPIRAFQFAALSASAQIQVGDFYLAGFSLLETTGAAGALVELFDGSDTNSPSVAPIALKASESTREWFGVPGITLDRGLFLSVLSGAVRGSVWLGER
jgi:hypothetical protein